MVSITKAQKTILLPKTQLVAEHIYSASARTGRVVNIKKTPVSAGKGLEKSICVHRVLQTHDTNSFSLHWIKFNWFSKYNQTLKRGGEPYVWIIVIQIFHFLYKHSPWVENERWESWRRHALTFSCLWHVERVIYNIHFDEMHRSGGIAIQCVLLG